MPGSDTITRDSHSSGDGIPTATPRLEMRLFGPMEVFAGGEPLPRLRTRKGLWLLALLALRGGRGVERDWVAGTLWPDSDEDDARRSLRQSLHDLRSALGPEAERLRTGERRTLRLDLAGADCDVTVFDDALKRGDPASLAEAVARYRGSFLLGCLEEWALPERDVRERAVVEALETLAAGARERGDLPDAAARLARALEIDPLREDLLCGFMEALAGQGREAEAAEAFRVFRRRLRDELNIAPNADTVGLYRRLRGGESQSGPPRPAASRPEPLPPVPGPAQIPAPLTTLIGRGREVEAVGAALEGARLVTLTGTGGVGKTRLALAVAQSLLDDFPQGVWFVDLAPLTDPQLLGQSVLSALGVSEQPDRSPVSVLTEFLRPKRLLLVLDNCEHLVSACAHLGQALLETCPALQILATSRETLGVPGELAWRVPSLSLPDTLKENAESEAVCLFVERARQVRPGWTPSAAEYAAVAAICRRLDGIPLAIELAAARVRSLPVEDISTRLGSGFGLLTSGGRALLPRQQTLAATFDWGWELLSGPERALLGRLSVFTGGWSLDAAEAVGPDDGADGDALRAEDVVDVLTALVDKSLVAYRPPGDGAEARYSLLETVRQYAGERLSRGGGAEAARDRHRDFFLNWVEKIEPNLWREEQSQGFRSLETDHDNLRAALEWCRSQSADEEKIRLVAVLGRFWNTHGHIREGRDHLADALSRMTPQMPARPCIQALLHAGWTALAWCDYPDARRYFEQALALIREYGTRQALALPLNCLAAVATYEGDDKLAEARYLEALSIAREFKLQGQLTAVLNNLGELATRRADYAAARIYLKESIDWSVTAASPQMQGLSLHNLSIVEARQGQYEEAEVHCRAGLRIYHESGTVVQIPSAMDQMVLLAQAQALPERAARLLGAAASFWDRNGNSQDRNQGQIIELTASIKNALGADTFNAAFDEGHAMDLDHAVAYALTAS